MINQKGKKKRIPLKRTIVLFLGSYALLKLGDHSFSRYSTDKSILNNESDPLVISPIETQVLLINHTNFNGVWGDFPHNFSGEIESVYCSLIKGGVPTNNIHIIDPNNTRRLGNNYEATERGLDSALDNIRENSSEGYFITYLTNHGEKDIGTNTLAYFSMNGKDEITECNLEEKFQGIGGKGSIAVFSTCYGGNFANRLGKEDRIAISNALPGRLSFGSGKGPLSEYFFPALLEILSQEEYSKADRNFDKRISVEEAFIYASEKDSFSHPLLPLIKNTYFLKTEDRDPSKIFIGQN